MSAQKLLTLGYLHRDDHILLAMKKRGFGAGKWNGFGGKVKPGESITDSFIRETQEEIGVTPVVFEPIAVHTFVYPGEEGEWEAHAFMVTQWAGDVAESEEMAPQWFDVKNIPYAQMWSDDPYWLPAALLGHKMNTRFVFDEQHELLSAQITRVASFDA